MNITEFLEARITEDEARAEGELGAQYFTEGAWPEEVADRMLAECAAKRAIISFHQYVRDGLCSTCVETGPDAQAFPCDTLKALAAVYSDHPDYQQDWAL